MGETGSGKTTLLDAFVNYLANINYEDPWRYKLVDENDIADLDSSKGQTSVITSY
jgi:ABC-type lipoprotein export system ATPase subunit